MYRIRETLAPEDLEEVIYWIRGNGRAWPVRADNVPLMANRKAFELNEDGLISTLDDLTKDPQETEEEDSEGILAATIDELQPGRLVFKLKMLEGHDLNEVSQAMVKTKTTSTGRGRRRNRAEVETELDLNAGVNLKLMKALHSWEGIGDENGNPVPITEDNIGRLPGWIQSDLVDRVDEMSSLTGAEQGE